MQLSYTPEYERFQKEVEAFVAEQWPLSGAEADLPSEEQKRIFRDRAVEAGYLYRSIPRQYGGSEQPMDILKARIIDTAFRKAKAPMELSGQGAGMLVPTLLELGTDEQKERYVRATIRGELDWCQGYSEPGAGSDLASLQTRGDWQGDHWIVNGQKIWTSNAMEADMMFALVRTEQGESKHAGISYLLIDMKDPGVRVSPLKQVTGTEEFCEVFLDDVKVPGENIVGKPGGGWKVSKATLVHERALIGRADALTLVFDALVKLARGVLVDGRPAIESEHVQQQLAEIKGYVDAQLYTGHRLLTSAVKLKHPGIIALMGKLHATNVSHMFSRLALDLIGDAALEAPSTVAYSPVFDGQLESWLGQWMWSPAIATAGGSANVQRNIIGERGLGLPRERAADESRGAKQ